jgi:hypothetical protein
LRVISVPMMNEQKYDETIRVYGELHIEMLDEPIISPFQSCPDGTSVHRCL